MAAERKDNEWKEAIRRSKQEEQEEEKKEEKFPTDTLEIIMKLKKLRDKNKMGLIIGRPDTEPIINEKGWIWVSFDIQNREIKPPTRYHIAGEDINENIWPLRLGKAVGFDKVVVDWSTLKFIQTPWTQLHQILKNNNESQLITELTTGLFLLRPTGRNGTVWKIDPKGYDVYKNILEMNENWKKLFS